MKGEGEDVGGVSQRLAEAVWRRDNYTCKRCGRKMSPTDLTLDLHHKYAGARHVNTVSRMVTLCKRCHDAIHRRGEVPE